MVTVNRTSHTEEHRVFQTVAEELGDGLLKGTQPSAWPRDMTQIYNLKKTHEGKSTSKA